MRRTTENSGVELRMNRIFSKNNRLFLLPLDHGINIGYEPNLNVRKQVEIAVKNNVDAIMIRPSMAKFISDLDLENTNIIMALTGKFDRRIDHLQLNTVEYAIQCGADAVCSEFKFGSEGDLENANISSFVSEQAHNYGIPHLITVYVREEQLKRSGVKAYAHACRIAEELGADIIKIFLPEDEEIIRMCRQTVNIPIITAGGDVVDDKSLVSRVKFYIDNGIDGVAIGRNVWANDDVDGITEKIKEVLSN